MMLCRKGVLSPPPPPSFEFGDEFAIVGVAGMAVTVRAPWLGRVYRHQQNLCPPGDEPTHRFSKRSTKLAKRPTRRSAAGSCRAKWWLIPGRSRLTPMTEHTRANPF